MSNPLGALEDGLPKIGDEPIIAWRQWGFLNGDLISLNGEPWPYRAPLEARHGKDDGERQGHDGAAPCVDKGCGIYAAKSLAALAAAGYMIKKDTGAFGSVKLWGRVVAHERGFRAQYAYPQRIYTVNRLEAELVRANYGCDVVLLEPPVPQPNVHIQGDAPIACEMNAIITLQINGFHHNYSGPCDPVAVGRWFAGLIAQLAATRWAQPNFQDYVQLQTRFWRP